MNSAHVLRVHYCNAYCAVPDDMMRWALSCFVSNHGGAFERSFRHLLGVAYLAGIAWLAAGCCLHGFLEQAYGSIRRPCKHKVAHYVGCCQRYPDMSTTEQEGNTLAATAAAR